MLTHPYHYFGSPSQDAGNSSNRLQHYGTDTKQLDAMSSDKSEGMNAGKRKRDFSVVSDEGAKSKTNGDVKTTLGSLLKYMEGYEIIVELKTGKRHRGRLLSADDNMNLMLEEQIEDQDDVISNTKGGNLLAAANPSTRNIRGSKIRYIHFPDNANLPMLVRSGRERERNAAKKYQKTKRSRK